MYNVHCLSNSQAEENKSDKEINVGDLLNTMLHGLHLEAKCHHYSKGYNKQSQTKVRYLSRFENIQVESESVWGTGLGCGPRFRLNIRNPRETQKNNPRHVSTRYIISYHDTGREIILYLLK